MEPIYGIIRYVLLVVSQPVEPTPSQMAALIKKYVPELDAWRDPNTKIAHVWKTEPMSQINMTTLAVEAFGTGAIDIDAYNYRSASDKIITGEETGYFIAYEKTK